MVLIISLLLIVIVVFSIRKKHTSKLLIPYVLAGGLIFGISGLLLGMLYAIILHPDNNLLPIIGILFTGPIGFISGLFIGYYYWKRKVQNENL